MPNLGKDIGIQVQEAQRVPNKMNPKRNTPRHIIIKMVKLKDKERILKAARKKQLITYMGNPIRLSVDFLAKNLQVRKEWHDILKVLKEKNCQPRILYTAKSSFRTEGEIEFSRQAKAEGVYHH